jgi:peptidoglycan/xylan/chitin deacetylase (PgdA/CDA1 family)
MKKIERSEFSPTPGLFSSFVTFLLWGAVLFFTATLLPGCGFVSPPDPPQNDGPNLTIVLTFDDGPLPADVADFQQAADRSSLLVPLNQILSVLEQKGATGVFYLKGPGTPEAGEAVKDLFTEAIDSLHQANQVMGYHAFNHNKTLWGRSTLFSDQKTEDMKNDLRQLKAYINQAAAPLGWAAGDVLTPVFRQPYGGRIFGWTDGWKAAAQLGLTYHGYDIDSFDWTQNIDAGPDIQSHFPAHTEVDHVAFVKEQIRKRADKFANAASVDILLHVNSFTATHLAEWIDELQTDFERVSGKTIIFAVPETYLIEPQTREDMAALSILLKTDPDAGGR